MMIDKKEITYSLEGRKDVLLTTAPGVFLPTGTTDLLIRAARTTLQKPVSVLDLGCGSGIVGLALFLHGLVKEPLCASDLSEAAVLCSRENFARYSCEADVRYGSSFEPWKGSFFDVIVDDISGVAQDVAAVSSWFCNVPCASGKDGADLVVDVIRHAPRYLSEGGRFFFPVISLSNTDRILNEARECFGTVEQIARQEWPLPAELKSHMHVLDNLERDGCIRFSRRFGMVLCYTEIYVASRS